jgi:ABC-type Fe3+-hydroxamate transport system substrate-binding protein
MSPRSVAEVGPAVTALANAVGAPVPEPFGPATWGAWLEERRRRRKGEPRRTFVLVWRRPWMTLAGDTYGSSLLHLLGCFNVFTGRGVRYPMVELSEAASRKPDLVLLPTEPYPFKERHGAEVAVGIPDAEVVIVDGQDLFWWGIRTPGAVDRLAEALPLRE